MNPDVNFLLNHGQLDFMVHEVYYYREFKIPGAVFIVSSEEKSYFIWTPYPALISINNHLCNHTSNGQTYNVDYLSKLVKKSYNEYLKSKSNQDEPTSHTQKPYFIPRYFSASINTSNQPNLKKPYPYEKLIIAHDFDNIQSIEISTPKSSFSSLKITAKHSSVVVRLYFHKGQTSELLDRIKTSFATLVANEKILPENGSVGSKSYNIIDSCGPLTKSLRAQNLTGLAEYTQSKRISNEYDFQYRDPLHPRKRNSRRRSKENLKKKTMTFHSVTSLHGSQFSGDVEISDQTSEYLKDHFHENVSVTFHSEVQVDASMLTSSAMPKATNNSTPRSPDILQEYVTIDKDLIPSNDLIEKKVNEAKKMKKFSKSSKKKMEKMAPRWEFGKNQISENEWLAFLDEEGRIKDIPSFKQNVFYRGLSPEIRKDVWPFLLNVYPFKSTYKEREQIYEKWAADYKSYKLQWTSITKEQMENFSLFEERKHRIHKDVVRTDRQHPLFKKNDSIYLVQLNDILLTYTFYNFDLGYCQGMSDLLSPILCIMKDESFTFACFVNLMHTMKSNFFVDTSGMKEQMESLKNIVQSLDRKFYQYLQNVGADNFFYCFRWLLVLFKREFETFEEIMRLWEGFWSCDFHQLHIYMCFAVLHMQKEEILHKKMRFEEILKRCVDLSGNLNMEEVVNHAIMLWKKHYRMIAYNVKKRSKGI